MRAAYEALMRAYQQYLGRTPSDDEIESHLGGDYSPAAIDRAVGFIARSPEAVDYAKRQSAPPPAEDVKARDPFETRPQPGDFSRVEGFNEQKWGTQNSVKYRAGEILARYPATPSGLKQAMNDPDFKKLFPNAKLVKGDTIDFGGVLSDFDRGVPVFGVDVGRAFDEAADTGGAWVWQDLINTGGSMGGASEKWRYPLPSGSNTTQPGGTPSAYPPIGPAPDTRMPQPEMPPEITLGQLAQTGMPQQDPYALSRAEDLYMSDLARQRAKRIGPSYGRPI